MDDGSYAVLYDGIGRAAGGVMLTVRQSTFERLAEASWAILEALTAGMHTSRLDIAADVLSGELRPTDFFRMLPAARTRSRREHWVLTLNGVGEEKLTIGSRMSARYVRIYTTAKRDGVRHELELKQECGGSAVASLRSGAAIGAVWAQEYGRLVQWH
jgi:hypothetical protein